MMTHHELIKVKSTHVLNSTLANYPFNVACNKVQPGSCPVDPWRLSSCLVWHHVDCHFWTHQAWAQASTLHKVPVLRHKPILFQGVCGMYAKTEELWADGVAACKGNCSCNLVHSKFELQHWSFREGRLQKNKCIWYVTPVCKINLTLQCFLREPPGPNACMLLLLCSCAESSPMVI